MARATEKKLVQIPLSGGVNQAVDERDAPPGTLTAATNVRIKRSLPVKRPGHSTVDLSNAEDSVFSILGNASGTNVLKEPAMVATVGEVPVLATTSGVLWASGEESGTPWLSPDGFISTAKPVSQRSHIWDGGTNSIRPDISSSTVSESGYRAIGWTYTGASALQVSVTTAEGKPVGVWRGTATYCCGIVIIAQHDVFYVLYTSGSQIKLVTLTPGSGGLTASAVTGMALVSGNPAAGELITFDVCVISQSRYWLAIGEIGFDTVNILDCSGATVTDSVGFVLPTANTSTPYVALWHDTDFDRVWLSYTYYDGADYWDVYLIYKTDGSWTVDGSGSDVIGVIPRNVFSYGNYELTANNTESTALGTRGTITLGASTAYTWWEIDMQVRVRSTTQTYSTYTIPNCYPISKPDDHGRVWVVLWDAQNPRNSGEPTAIYWYALIRLRAELTPVPGGGTATLIAPVVELNVGPFPMICDNGSGRVNVTESILIDDFSHQAAPAIGDSFSTFPLVCNLGSVLDLREVTYTTAEQDPHFHVAEANPTIVTAGQVTEHFGGAAGIYSGTTKYVLGGAECGFVQKPRILDIPASSASTATRAYVAVFRWADVNGRAHRSAPSAPLVVENLDVTQLLVSTPTLGQRVDWSGLGFSPLVEIYGTQDGGTSYQFINVKALANPFDPTVNFDVGLLAPSESAGFVYTDGGVIENWIAPSNTFHVFTDDRLCLGGGFDPRVLTFSKIIFPQESIQFTESEAFQVVVPRDVTGLAFMDGAVIAFTADAIYQVTGQGPNDQGIGEFSAPTLMWGGVGCINYKSVFRTELGVFFQSIQGFFVLPRGLGRPEFVGTAVRTETDSYPDCLGATVAQTKTYNVIMFLMAADGGTSATVRLIYDIDRQIWFKDTLTLAASEIGNWNGQVGMLRQDLTDTSPSALWLEDETLSRDATVAFSQIFTTAWVYPFNQGGYGHFRKCQISYELLGTASTVLLSVQIDGNTAETHTWTDSGAANDIIYHELSIAVTQGSCCKVSLTESGSFGIRAVACVLEVDDDGGIRLLDPTMRA